MPGRVRRRRYASIIIVPPQRDRPLNFNLPTWAYYLLLGGLGALVVMVVGAIVLTSWLGVELRHLRGVEERNLRLEVEAAKVERLERELDELEDLRLRVLELAGLDVREQIEARTEERLQQGATTLTGLGEKVAIEPGATVVPFGTMPSLWPAEGVISKEFRMGGDPGATHHGIDIAAAHGTPVRASGAGSVIYAGRDSVFGQLVVISHGKDVLSLYGHNSRLMVGQGDQVKRGETIARVGSTGESSAPHLHFEVRRAGDPIDPRTFLVD